MQGPLKAVIRNHTDRPLIYGVIPRLYIQPQGEFTLNFDPFTRWSDSNALEPLLIDIRRGNAQLVYEIDPLYAVAGGKKDIVHLSINAEAKASGNPVPGAPKPAPKLATKPVSKVGVPFGKTIEDMRTEEEVARAEKDTKTGAIGGTSTHPSAILNAEVVQKIADAKPQEAVDLSNAATEMATKVVELVPETKEAIAEQPVAKKTRKKKEVVQL